MGPLLTVTSKPQNTAVIASYELWCKNAERQWWYRERLKAPGKEKELLEYRQKWNERQRVKTHGKDSTFSGVSKQKCAATEKIHWTFEDTWERKGITRILRKTKWKAMTEETD